MSEAFNAADVSPVSMTSLRRSRHARPGEVSGIPRRDFLRTGALGLAGLNEESA
jgi:hypothetical protein